ncbi:hypothetical protein LCGC14_2757640, partial [marine sediment metagenome]
CELLSNAATRILPPFIAKKYELLVIPAPFPEWSESRPLEVRLRDRGTHDEFPIGQVASGFRIWIQMALLESLDELRAREIALLDELHFVNLVAEIILEEAPHDVDDLEEELNEWSWEDVRSERDAITGCLNVIGEFPGSLTIERRGGRSLPNLLDWPEEDKHRHRNLFESLRQILYVIDEPEQHLHPGLQREAATWLKDTMGERRSQCVVTTHSAPFLSLASGVRCSYVERVGDRASVFPFEPAELDGLSGIAAQMGLDRGELLTLVSAFLFVEGLADKWVLEALFRERLSAAGIAVVPVHSVAKMKATAEAEALFRFTRANAAVLADGLDEAAIAELRSMIPDHEATQAALDEKEFKKRTEYYAMIQLVRAAQRNQRQIEIYGLGAPDIFDLLDENLIRSQCERFPGHHKARADFEALR